MKNLFHNLTENILDSYGFTTERVEGGISDGKEHPELECRYRCSGGLVVNELLTNALKVPFPAGTLGKIKFTILAIIYNFQ
jgi:two-component sensor histidine kinase